MKNNTVATQLPDGWYTKAWTHKERTDWWRENMGHEDFIGTLGVWPNVFFDGKNNWFGLWGCWLCDIDKENFGAITKDFRRIAKPIEDEHATCIFQHINSPDHSAKVDLLRLANEK